MDFRSLDWYLRSLKLYIHRDRDIYVYRVEQLPKPPKPSAVISWNPSSEKKNLLRIFIEIRNIGSSDELT